MMSPLNINKMMRQGKGNIHGRRQAGDWRKAECISCNSCFGPPSEGKGFYCVTMAKKRGKTM
jgi:hypothetical protein